MATTTHYADSAHNDVDAHEGDHQRNNKAVQLLSGITRLSLGWVFLWAFLDKAFSLGFATGAKIDEETGARTGIDTFGDSAWLNGGSPTEGFLMFGVPAHNPFKDTFNSMAGQGWADWLFMIGLLGIGVALILGVFMNFAAISGAVLLVLMWLASLPLENNPFMDDHLVYALVLLLLAAMHAGRYLGLGKMWERLPFVQKSPILR